MLTPFSGLSLLIHLAVIGLAKVVGLIRRRNQPAHRSQRLGPVGGWKNQLAAVGIILVVSSMMLFSFAVALMTSVREAPNEWHVRTIERTIDDWRETEFGTLRYIAEYREAILPKETVASIKESAWEAINH